jgi:hypothetical protein
MHPTGETISPPSKVSRPKSVYPNAAWFTSFFLKSQSRVGCIRCPRELRFASSVERVGMEAPACFPTNETLHYYASLESFVKAKWQMMRRPKRSTIRTDVYEIRPRANKHGVDLVSDALPYSPMWYRGSKAIRDAIDHAKFYSRSHSAVIRVLDSKGNLEREISFNQADRKL